MPAPTTPVWPTETLWSSASGEPHYASSATGVETPTTPTNGEKIAGAVSETAITSSRWNWLFKTLSQWVQKLRDVVGSQHSDDGDHYEVFCSGGVSAVKLTVAGQTGEADTDYQVVIQDETGNARAAISRAGRVLSERYECFGVADFQPISVKSTSQYDEWTIASNGGSGDFGGGSPDSSTRYLISRALALRPGERLTEISLKGNLNDSGQSIVLKAGYKAWDADLATAPTFTSGVSLTGSTGNLNGSQAVSVDGADDRLIYLRLEVNDNSVAQASVLGVRFKVEVV